MNLNLGSNEFFRALGIINKYYNKEFIIKDRKQIWYHNIPKRGISYFSEHG